MANPSLGVATLRTSLDRSGLTTGLNTARRETEQTLSTLDRRLQQVGTRMTGLGQTMSLAITAPLTALGGLSLKAASDAEETESKFRTVFSNIGDAAERANRRLADSYGLSNRAAQQLLGDTGDLLTGFGFTQEAALDLSTQVNELAVDLASFTNYSGGAEGASAALTKALLGEREAAKGLGIAITEDVVKAKIADMRASGELVGATEAQARAYATLAVAQEQSGNAMGDFARTQDSFANQTRILRANVDDLAVSLGQGILPLATPIVSGMADMAAAFAGMNESTRTTILLIGGGAAAAGPLLLGLGHIVTIAPKVVTGLRSIQTAMAFMGPAGLAFTAIGVIGGLAIALASGQKDSLAGALDDARDAVGGAGDKDSLVGALDTLRGDVDGPVAAALDRLIEKVNESGTSFDDAKAAADRFFDTVKAQDAARLAALAAQRDQLLEMRANARQDDPQIRIDELRARGNEIFEAAPGGILTPEQQAEIDSLHRQIQQLELAASGVGAAIFGPEEEARLQELNEQIRELETNLGLLNAAASETPDAGATGGASTPRRSGTGGAIGAPGGRTDTPATPGSLRALDEQLAAEREIYETTTGVVREQAAARMRVLQAEIDEVRSLLRSVDTDPGAPGRRTGSGLALPTPGLGDRGTPLPVGEINVASGARVTLERPTVEAGFNLDAFATNARIQDRNRRIAENARFGTEEALEAYTRSAISRGGAAAGPAGVLNLPARGDGGLAEATEIVTEKRQEEAREARELARDLRIAAAASRELREGLDVEAWRFSGQNARTFTAGRAGVPLMTPEQEAFGTGAGELSLDLGRRAARGDGGLGEAREIIQEQRETIDMERRAAEDRANILAGAAVSFSNTLVDAIQTGDIGAAFASLADTGGGLAQSLIGGWQGILLGGAISLFGGLLGGAFGGGTDRERMARAEGARTRGAPAVEFNLMVQQSLNVQSLTDPASRAAVDGLLNETVRRITTVIEKNVLPRIDRLEATA